MDHPSYPGWADWLGGIVELWRFHEVAGWREVCSRGVPAELFFLDARRAPRDGPRPRSGLA